MILLLLSSNCSSISFAEPFYFHPKLVKDVKNNLSDIKNIGEKIKYLDDSVYKISLIDNSAKDLIIRDINALKKDIIKTNIRDYTINKYLTWSKVAIIKKYKPFYLGLKNKDLKVDIHINYINYLESSINNNLDLDENNSLYKAYIYILYSYNNKNLTKNTWTQDILDNLNSFSNSNELTINKSYYENKYNKLITLEKFNPLSKNDFSKIYSKIQKENISPDSDYMKWFQFWYANYKEILTKNTIALKSNLNHAKQEYSLSCEANSIKDVINYYNSKNNRWLISENNILSILSANTWSLARNESWSLIWADPQKEFVWNYTWKQSINPDNFSWYWVYANPIINSTQNIFSSNSLAVKKTTFNEKNILNSIMQDNPVMFWYLSEVKIGKKNWYQTKPISWKTKEWNIINWYIWEHTWVIIWFDISKDWRIEKIYYYEWKTSTIQTMDYNFAKQVASFFNEMIVVNNSNSLNLAYSK